MHNCNKTNQQWEEHNSFLLEFQQLDETLYFQNEQKYCLGKNDDINHVLTSPITVLSLLSLLTKWYIIVTAYVITAWFTEWPFN